MPAASSWPEPIYRHSIYTRSFADRMRLGHGQHLRLTVRRLTCSSGRRGLATAPRRPWADGLYRRDRLRPVPSDTVSMPRTGTLSLFAWDEEAVEPIDPLHHGCPQRFAGPDTERRAQNGSPGKRQAWTTLDSAPRPTDQKFGGSNRREADRHSARRCKRRQAGSNASTPKDAGRTISRGTAPSRIEHEPQPGVSERSDHRFRHAGMPSKAECGACAGRTRPKLTPSTGDLTAIPANSGRPADAQVLTSGCGKCP